MAPKRAITPETSSDVWLSEQSDYRESAFIGAFSPTLMRRELQAIPRFKSASHRMVAWRIPSKQKTLTASTTYDLGHDDDGEKWAGKKLENLLDKQKIEGCVVVARWYGGVNIGPIRFTMIEAAAKDAIYKWKDDRNLPVTPAAKRMRLDENTMMPIPGVVTDAAETAQPPSASKLLRPDEISALRKTLVPELEERDNSIVVLRNLLDKKRAKLGHLDSSKASPAKDTSPAKKPDYSVMTLTRLQALEKGRDASISYLLKELNKVEEEQAEEDELNKAFVEVAAHHESSTPNTPSKSPLTPRNALQPDGIDKNTTGPQTPSKSAKHIADKG